LIQPFLLILALVWLITSQPPRYLWNYISAQAAVTLCLYSTLVFYSVSTTEYARVWALCTIALALTYMGLAHFFLAKHPAKGLALLSATLLSAFCVFVSYRHLSKPLHAAEWLGIAAGAILVACGTLLGVSAPYHHGKDRAVALTLGLLFIFQSLWNVGFVLHSIEEWEKANYVVPTMLCVAGWGWLGFVLRSSSKRSA
jgi:hypothetical protein